MPICDDKNEQPSTNKKTEIDHHASEAAKIKRTRDQAYFNSYDFDAIDILPSESDVSENKKIDLNHQTEPPTNSSLKISLDDANMRLSYLKRFTSIFVPINKKLNDIENQINEVDDNIIIKNEELSNSSSNRSSINSTSNLYENSNNDENNKINNNSNNKNNNNSGFVLPRAMLKYQSSGSSMPSSSSSAISTTSNSSASKLQIDDAPLLQDDIITINSHASNTNIIEIIADNIKTISSIPTTSFIDAEKSLKISLFENKKNSGLFHMKNEKDALDHHQKLRNKNSNVINLLASGNNKSRILYDKANPKSVSILIPRDSIQSASNYSTDKSGGGSSGYYSSNLCSASSVEEHIYSEPVIDIIEHDNSGIKRQYKLNQGIQNYNNKKPVSSASYHYQNIKDQDDRNQKMNESLRILETSIENLDRHLKAFPKFEHVQASFIQTFPNSSLENYERIKIENNDFIPNTKHLPTIMEGIDNQSQKKASSWENKSDDIIDDSLMDIDLDSFVLSNGKKKNLIHNEYPISHYQSGGIDNPSFVDNEIFLNEEVVESNYKCAKYINSCPENAYQVESDSDAGSSDKLSNAFFLKKYEDQIHFQNTREMLEDIQDKIRKIAASINENEDDCVIPKELEKHITILKTDLEQYLQLMNRNSEMEIKQFFNSLVNNEKMLAITNAFERRKSTTDAQYEPLRNLSRAGGAIDDNFQPTFIHSSDPNFKLKRKSLSEILTSDDLLRLQENQQNFRRSYEKLDIQESNLDRNKSNSFLNITQLQRNLSFHRPILENHDIRNEKDLIKEWHRNKPSIWEMYYGSNRVNQTLITRSGPVGKNGKPMSYPSSRPESDFTLDLPRAEQLRIKMNQEKKFRQRCRIITTFLSLVFFLLTVMIVSLVLTRGKRMFGSML